jgi:hypothetical protein
MSGPRDFGQLRLEDLLRAVVDTDATTLRDLARARGVVRLRRALDLVFRRADGPDGEAEADGYVDEALDLEKEREAHQAHGEDFTRQAEAYVKEAENWAVVGDANRVVDARTRAAEASRKAGDEFGAAAQAGRDQTQAESDAADARADAAGDRKQAREARARARAERRRMRLQADAQRD